MVLVVSKELVPIKLNDIVPASYNPRKISAKEYANLENSLDEFGLVDPIIVNLKNNRIISGHQRFDILYSQNPNDDVYLLKLGDIGWVIKDKNMVIRDEAHEKALNLALNRIRGEFDIPRLNDILDELMDLNLTEITGFDLGLDDISYEFEEVTTKKYQEKKEFDKANPPKKQVFDELKRQVDEDNSTLREITQNEKEFVKKHQVYKIKNSLIFCGTYNETELNSAIHIAYPKLRNHDSVHLIKSVDMEIPCFHSKDFKYIEEVLRNYNDYVLRVR